MNKLVKLHVYCISCKTLQASFIPAKSTRNTIPVKLKTHFIAKVTHSLVYNPSTNTLPSVLGDDKIRSKGQGRGAIGGGGRGGVL
jgi:hypothetical protein